MLNMYRVPSLSIFASSIPFDSFAINTETKYAIGITNNIKISANFDVNLSLFNRATDGARKLDITIYLYKIIIFIR